MKGLDKESGRAALRGEVTAVSTMIKNRETNLILILKEGENLFKLIIRTEGDTNGTTTSDVT